MRVRSITLRISLYFSAVATAVLLAMGYLIGAAVEKHFEEQDLHEFDGKLALIRHTLARVRSVRDLDDVPKWLDDALIGHHELSVQVIEAGGRTLYAPGDRAVIAPLLAQPVAGAAGSQPAPLVWMHGGKTYRGVLASASTGIAGAGPAAVALALDIDHHVEFLAAFRKSHWLALGAGIVLTALMGWFAARHGLAPVREMAALAQGISASRLQNRIALEAVPPELAELASAFNGMLARLEDSFRRLSDYSSDLAHELRTPVSNLMTQTQVAISRARSADEYREVLYSNLEEYDRLARMIGDMLFLAKADHGLIAPRGEPVRLAEEVRQLFDYYAAFAEEQGVRLQLQGEAQVPGDRLMLRRALDNLLSNAIRHTSRDGMVKVLIDAPEPGTARVAIENPGETIPAEHLARLFDRFYRVDSSRQRSQEGVGLGLAIARAIVEAHRGSIGVTSAAGLTRFQALLPSA